MEDFNFGRGDDIETLRARLQRGAAAARQTGHAGLYEIGRQLFEAIA